MRTTIMALAATALTVCACSAGSSGRAAPAGPRSDSSSSIPAPTESVAAAPLLGFDVVLDTGGYTASRLVLLHRGVPRPLSHVSYTVVGAILSADGKRIAFSSPRGIGVMGLDGHVQRLIPGTKACFVGGWGSNSAVVASCGRGSDWPPGPVDGTWTVSTISLDGTKRHALGRSDAGTSPSASPVSHAVAYGLNNNTYLVAGAARRARLLLRGVEGVTWSSDGKYIAYGDEDSTGARRIRIADSNGRAQRTVVTLPNWSGDLSVAFSPDGRSIIYAGSADTTADLWRVGVTGGRPAQLTTTGEFGDPCPL